MYGQRKAAAAAALDIMNATVGGPKGKPPLPGQPWVEPPPPNAPPGVFPTVRPAVPKVVVGRSAACTHDPQQWDTDPTAPSTRHHTESG